MSQILPVLPARSLHARLPAMLVGLLLLALLGASPAEAAEVDFRFASREAWVGAPLVVEVEVSNASTITPPVLPEVEGASIRLLPGERSSSFTQVVNGRVTTRQSRLYTIEIRPSREGTIEVPPIEVSADGRTFRSETTTITARKSVTGDLLLAQVLGEPPQVILGEPMEVTLRLVVRPYESEQHDAVLSEADMWSLLDLEGSELGVFRKALEELAQQRRRPLGRAVEVDGRTYYLYDLTTRIQPLRAGPPDLGPLSITLNYPTGLRADRDFFGRRQLSLAGARPLVAVPEVLGLDVLPLPEQGRPDSFAGAVGSFAIRASASPTDAAVGDPITLTLEIEDLSEEGTNLALLQAPPLDRDAALVEGFRLPPGSPAGVVDGRTKTFTQTLRPISDEVKAIPPIEFSWFDPQAREYRAARTAAIPITVRPTETMSLSQVVQADSGSPRSISPPGETAPTAGLLANRPADASLLADEDIDLGPSILAWIMVPPIAAALLAVFLRRRRMLALDPALARASRARRTAVRRLGIGGADAVATAISGYVADRARLPSPTITRQEVREVLESHGADETLRDEVDRILRACERARFTGASIDDPAIAREARAALERLDRLRWTRTAASDSMEGVGA